MDHTGKKKALIAMSGGVDSSVAALRMLEQGYDCVGVTMRLYNSKEIGLCKKNSCCSMDDIVDAKSVAYKLGIAHHVIDFQADFKEKVMDPFVQSYLEGKTPNPCIECNRHLKFAHLYQTAKDLGCDVIVTGHYARILSSGEYSNYTGSADVTGHYHMLRAVDSGKDQSYVLYNMTQNELAHTRFPLGNLSKEEVRRIAEAHGFVNARKHDSQDICFIEDGDYKRFMREYYEVKIPEGDFVDKEGRVLGTHKGYYAYTIGQRKGLGIAAEHPYYVVDIRPKENLVVLGRNEDLFHKTLVAEHMTYVSDETNESETVVSEWSVGETYSVEAKVRYRQQAQPARLTCLSGGQARIEFKEPQRAITRGQAVVIYRGEEVLGGGTISSVEA